MGLLGLQEAMSAMSSRQPYGFHHAEAIVFEQDI